MTTEHFDVLIIGAGISGIGAAYYLQTKSPNKSYAILEGRENLGGTWDLFRYPGVRSDSDMYTLGYAFKPWTEAKSIADGPHILSYLKETAEENGIDKHIRYSHKVQTASWSSETSLWTLEVANGENSELTVYTCNFFFQCSGYYNYDAGFTPNFAGRDSFPGPVVHPQFWPQDLEYTDKKVVIIGSGATAVTLLPKIAEKAAHVTMLQRSPTYMVTAPATDPLSTTLRKYFPETFVYRALRWRNVLRGMAVFWYMRKKPARSKDLLIGWLKPQLAADYDIERHFTPSYNPWDQRLCLVPEGDLFTSIRKGDASVVTDHIDTFTEKGILLKSGQELEADVIVTATGLDMQLGGNVALSVDGVPVNYAEKMTYKGMMLSDVPNMAFSMGYTNASWTLKVDVTCEHVCRLLNYMEQHNYQHCVAHCNDDEWDEENMLDFSSGYVQRALEKLPKSGAKKPWKLYQNYVLDLITLGFGKVTHRALKFK